MLSLPPKSPKNAKIAFDFAKEKEFFFLKVKIGFTKYTYLRLPNLRGCPIFVKIWEIWILDLATLFFRWCLPDSSPHMSKCSCQQILLCCPFCDQNNTTASWHDLFFWTSVDQMLTNGTPGLGKNKRLGCWIAALAKTAETAINLPPPQSSYC